MKQWMFRKGMALLPADDKATKALKRLGEGEVFGRLTILSEAPPKSGQKIYICRCECGNVGNYYAGNLRSGRCQSCGCLRQDSASKTHRKHGRAGSEIYSIWSSMISRCRAHPRYAGRGIKVCDRWQKFENFLADMGERPDGKSIDRWPDNNGDYSPENCRWATDQEQNLNKGNTRLITAFGETAPLVVMAAKHGIPFRRLWKRINAGWSPEDAISKPPRVAV